MKLAVRKEQGAVPGGGFHYMLHPMKLGAVSRSEDIDATLYEQMGYIIIEVEADHGARLLDEARAALNHQVEVATLAERALAEEVKHRHGDGA